MYILKESKKSQNNNFYYCNDRNCHSTRLIRVPVFAFEEDYLHIGPTCSTFFSLSLVFLCYF